MSPQSKIIFICGPTAIGKSAVAAELAEIIDGEIISCDAMQVYREVRIASNKPKNDILEKIPHHLLDVVSVSKNFDVAKFYSLAIRSVDEILQREKIPIVVGGSGMYMRAILDGLYEDAPRDDQLRQDLEQEIMNHGLGQLYQKLVEVDAASAASIHPNDQKRIIRALEIFYTKGKPKSELTANRPGLWGKHKILYFGINANREALYNAVNVRVDEMFDQGLIDEVQQTLKCPVSSTAAKIIGLNEVQCFLNDKFSLEEAKEEMKKNTRHYAKRQLTWFNKDERIEWLHLQDFSGAKDMAKTMLERISS